MCSKDSVEIGKQCYVVDIKLLGARKIPGLADFIIRIAKAVSP